MIFFAFFEITTINPHDAPQLAVVIRLIQQKIIINIQIQTRQAQYKNLPEAHPIAARPFLIFHNVLFQYREHFTIQFRRHKYILQGLK